MTKIERTCPRCGLVCSSGRLGGLCPACLITGLLDQDEPDDGRAFWEDDESSSTGVAQLASVRRFSHFELIEELGRGGMGIVYRARDIATSRVVALKVLQAHHLEVPDLVQRFRSEVRAVTSLDHPNVLPVHEVGEYEGIPFFSMKLTTGGSLAQRIGEFLGKPRDAARLLARVARGVAHAHERGILHRDLKPGNILIDSAGEPYVCDFGLAKWIDDDRKLTMTAAVLGTPHYIAPEQATGKKGLTTAADIYSLGAILYELITARPPFIGTSIIETLRLASEKTPERPSSLVNNVPGDLETICLKCLEREPVSRYPSATALAVDLENWLDGRPINARPVTAGEQLWRWARRNPLPASLIAVIFLALAAIAIGSTVFAFRIDHERALAVAAQKDAREKLYDSKRALAKAARLTGRSGQRTDSIKALLDAAEIHHDDPELRNELISSLALTDLTIDPHSITIGPNTRPSRSFDSSCTHIAEQSERGVIRIWNLADQRVAARLDAPDSPRDTIDIIRYSSGNLLAARHSNGATKVWNVETQKKLLEIDGPSIPKAPWYAPSFAFSPDTRLFASALAKEGASILDTETGRQTHKIDLPSRFRCLEFSPDGRQLALAADEENRLYLWDLAQNRLAGSIELPAAAYSIAWSPDGNQLVVGSRDYNLYLYDLPEARLAGTFTGHRQEVTQVLFTPKGDRIVSTSLDRTIRLWSLGAIQEVMLADKGVEPAMRFSADGAKLLVTAAGSTAFTLSIDGADPLFRTLINASSPGRATLVGGVAFSPDSTRVATASYESIELWDTRAGRLLASLPIDPDKEKSVRFGDDSETLLIGSRASGLTEYKIAIEHGRARLTRTRVLDPRPEFIFSNSPPGDRHLVGLTSSKLGIARIFDLRTLSDLVTIEGQPDVWDLAISPDTRWFTLAFSAAAPAENGNTQVWSLDGNIHRLERTLDCGQNGTTRFSPGGHWLKVTGRGNIGVWSIDDWKRRSDHDYSGSFTAFDPAGHWIATYASETVTLWSADANELCKLTPPNLPNTTVGTSFRLASSPDGQTLAAHTSSNILLVWNLQLLKEELARYGLSWSD